MEHWFTWLDWRTEIWLMILVNQFIGIHVQLYCIKIIFLLIQNIIVLSIKMQLNELWNWLKLKHQSLLNDFVTKSDYLELLLILFPPRPFFNLSFFTYCCGRLLFWETRAHSNSSMTTLFNVCTTFDIINR